jgi:hypothetical protein
VRSRPPRRSRPSASATQSVRTSEWRLPVLRVNRDVHAREAWPRAPGHPAAPGRCHGVCVCVPVRVCVCVCLERMGDV